MEPLIPGLPDDMSFECLIRVPLNSHTNLNSVCHPWKNLVSNPSFYKERLKSENAENLVFLVQPLSSSTTTLPVLTIEHEEKEKHQVSQPHCTPTYGFTVYNASHDTWQRITSSICFRIPMFCECVVVSSLGKLILIGGWDPVTLEAVADVYIFDLRGGGGGFRRGAPMTVARSFFGCAAVGDEYVYVAGGHDNQKNALQSAEVYNVETDKWRTLPPMLDERDECRGVSLEGEKRFWVVSGYGTESQGRFHADAECYNPMDDSWSKIEGFWAFPNSSPKSISMTQDSAKWRFINEGGVKEYNEGENIWKVVGSVPEGTMRSSPCVAQLDHNRIFVMGPCTPHGGTNGNGDSHGGFILETDTGKWTHIETPSSYSGFVYSACSVLI